MLGPIGLPELGVILVIVLVIFGAGKLPQVGKSLGKGIKEFQSAIKGSDEESNENKKGEIKEKTGE
ncbi:MAG: twin-arginine translocase TatA/TatE family subunit [bacterium]